MRSKTPKHPKSKERKSKSISQTKTAKTSPNARRTKSKEANSGGKINAGEFIRQVIAAQQNSRDSRESDESGVKVSSVRKINTIRVTKVVVIDSPSEDGSIIVYYRK